MVLLQSCSKASPDWMRNQTFIAQQIHFVKRGRCKSCWSRKKRNDTWRLQSESYTCNSLLMVISTKPKTLDLKLNLLVREGTWVFRFQVDHWRKGWDQLLLWLFPQQAHLLSQLNEMECWGLWVASVPMISSFLMMKRERRSWLLKKQHVDLIEASSAQQLSKFRSPVEKTHSNLYHDIGRM